MVLLINGGGEDVTIDFCEFALPFGCNIKHKIGISHLYMMQYLGFCIFER